jgi:flagellin
VSVRINTNIEALNAQRNLSATALTFSKSVEKLSSGLRINRAADDAAGLAISEKLQAQVTGLNQAERNAQDGISMVQTAEGALNEVHSMLQRIRELAVEASNSTLSSSDAQSVSTEITALRAEIDRIAGATTFNGQYLLTGALSVNQTGGTIAAGKALLTGGNATLSAIDLSNAKASTTYSISKNGGTVTLSDGNGNAQTVTLADIGASGVETVNFTNLGVKLTVTGTVGKTAANVATDLASTIAIGGSSASDAVVGDTLGTPATNGGTITAMTVTPAVAAATYTFTSSGANKLTLGALATDVAISDMSAGQTQTLTFGGVSLTITAGAGGFTAANAITALTTAGNSTVVVTGTAAGTGAATVITGAGAGANFQVGANAADSMGVTFADAQLNAAHTAAGYGALYTDISNFATATTTNGGSGIITGAQQLITDVDVAIGYVSTIRGNLGAVQNRLEHTVASISVASENLNASESRIRDLDVASEMVNFTKTQILQQAGTAILAQANSAPQNILTLLR